MTISYNWDVATSTPWSFLRVVFRWRASVWKTVLFEFSLWIAGYYLVFVTYHYILNDNWQREFRRVAKYINNHLDHVSLSFILGFFVNLVVDRWKRMFDNIGFIDTPCLNATAYIRPNAEGTNNEALRLQRRNIARWLCLAQVLVLRDISIRVRKRFPTLESLEQAGYLEPAEREILSQIAEPTRYQVYWVPFSWVYTALAKLYETGVMRSPGFLRHSLQDIRNYRRQLQVGAVAECF